MSGRFRPSGRPACTACRRTFPQRCGTACVEFAVVLPILLSSCSACWRSAATSRFTRSSMRRPAKGRGKPRPGQMTNAQVIAAVNGCVQAAGLPTDQLTVTVSDLTSPGTDVSQATILDNLQVTVTLPYISVRWSPDHVLHERDDASFDDGLLGLGQPAELSEQRDGAHGELTMRRTKASRTAHEAMTRRDRPRRRRRLRTAGGAAPRWSRRRS